MATTESKVISALCKNKDMHAVMGEELDIFGAYGDVVEFMRQHYMKHKSVPDFGIIEERFSRIEKVETTAPTPYYLEQLKDEFVRARIRQLIDLVDTRLDAGDTGGVILEKMQQKAASLGKYTNAVRDLNMTNVEAASEHFSKLREQSAENGSPGIATGFKSIDAMYPTGMAPGHSIVLMGYTGRGKSMWSALLAVKAWQQGKRVMVVSLEMSPEEYRERVYAMMSSGMFRISDLSRGDIADDDFRTWSKKAFDNAADFIVVSNQGVADVTPNTIQAKIDTHRPDIVILDYLQLMTDNAKTGPMTPRMLNLSREVKLLAVSNNIPIVSITAVTDEDGDKRDGPPVLSQVAWSKGIEYDANLVIAIHRHDDTNIVEVVCRKSRHGDPFDFGFEVDFDRGIWIERHDAF